jgi:hypothetical protein
VVVVPVGRVEVVRDGWLGLARLGEVIVVLDGVLGLVGCAGAVLVMGAVVVALVAVWPGVVVAGAFV